MSIMTENQEDLAAEDTVDVEIIDDVNNEAEDAIGLGCGDDNPYR
ncbi:hypothetical protein [Actinomadura sp. WAC 06369]|nr:hypothetical protein [Actinomadura sp. WAC 06369]